jgi:hypothetical protein
MASGSIGVHHASFEYGSARGQPAIQLELADEVRLRHRLPRHRQQREREQRHRRNRHRGVDATLDEVSQ